jgi:hypothetical protein
VGTTNNDTTIQEEGRGGNIFSPRILKQQTAEKSNALIQHFQDSPASASLAKFEGELTIRRGREEAQTFLSLSY